MVLCVSSEHAISPQGLSLESAPASGVPWPWPPPPTVSAELCHCSKQIRVRILVPHSPACTSGSASPPGRPRRTRPCLRIAGAQGRGMWNVGPAVGPRCKLGAPQIPLSPPPTPPSLKEGEVKVLLMSASRSPRPARLLRGRGWSEGSRRAARPRCPAGATLPASPRSRAAAAASERWSGSAPSTAPRAVSFRAERAPTPRAADAFQGWAADPAWRHQQPGRGRPALPRASVSFPQGRGSRSVSYSPSKRCCSNCRAPHATGPTRGSCPGRPSRRRGSRAVPAARPRPHSE